MSINWLLVLEAQSKKQPNNMKYTELFLFSLFLLTGFYLIKSEQDNQKLREQLIIQKKVYETKIDSLNMELVNHLNSHTKIIKASY